MTPAGAAAGDVSLRIVVLSCEQSTNATRWCRPALPVPSASLATAATVDFAQDGLVGWSLTVRAQCGSTATQSLKAGLLYSLIDSQGRENCGVTGVHWSPMHALGVQRAEIGVRIVSASWSVAYSLAMRTVGVTDTEAAEVVCFNTGRTIGATSVPQNLSVSINSTDECGSFLVRTSTRCFYVC